MEAVVLQKWRWRFPHVKSRICLPARPMRMPWKNTKVWVEGSACEGGEFPAWWPGTILWGGLTWIRADRSNPHRVMPQTVLCRTRSTPRERGCSLHCGRQLPCKAPRQSGAKPGCGCGAHRWCEAGFRASPVEQSIHRDQGDAAWESCCWWHGCRGDGGARARERESRDSARASRSGLFWACFSSRNCEQFLTYRKFANIAFL